MLSRFIALFELATGRPLAEEDQGSASRAQVVVRATLASVVFGSVYGLAAGSTDIALAVSNLYKIPMVVILSSLCALPAGLLTWKLTGAQTRAGDLFLGVAAGNFTATLVLAAMAPIVALYYHTSGFLGGTLALAASALAVGLGLFNVVRSVLSRRPEGVSRRVVALPLAVLIGAQLAALVQFIHVASPILPETTVFDGGVDAMMDS